MDVDFSHLPTDALCVVFQHLFVGQCSESGLPLSEFLKLWTTCRLVCKHWSDVLVDHPPPLHLDVSALPEAWLAWLPRLPVCTLRIQHGLDARWCGTSGQQTGDDDESTGPLGMPSPLSALRLVEGLEGCGVPRPFWSLTPFAQLQVLHLQAAVSDPERPAVFDCAALQGLDQLTTLSLGSFADFRLEQLPPAVRRLRLRYDTQNRQLSVPTLPDHVSRLELLRLEKAGVVGLMADECWGVVEQVEVHAQELLVGVLVDDMRLVRTFERPYREGNFVPPHIWGDEEADDNSKQAAAITANHFLSRLPECSVLQRLCVSGPAAHSCKFMPVAPHRRDTLPWLWSVVRLQGLHNLYGLSGREMQSRQQLYEDRLAFEFGLEGPESIAISVVREGDAAAAAGSVVPAPAEPQPAE